MVVTSAGELRAHLGANDLFTLVPESSSAARGDGDPYMKLLDAAR